MENILYLRKMGCNFYDHETAQSDIKNYSYTQADILAIVNEISSEKYDRIEFVN